MVVLTSKWKICELSLWSNCMVEYLLVALWSACSWWKIMYFFSLLLDGETISNLTIRPKYRVSNVFSSARKAQEGQRSVLVPLYQVLPWSDSEGGLYHYWFTSWFRKQKLMQHNGKYSGGFIKWAYWSCWLPFWVMFIPWTNSWFPQPSQQRKWWRPWLCRGDGCVSHASSFTSTRMAVGPDSSQKSPHSSFESKFMPLIRCKSSFHS